MKTRKAVNQQPKFENRVRFNWGYHDAAQAVQQGWNTPERNFGFGPSIKIGTPSDVLVKHFDPEYAQGWFFGYHDAMQGKSTVSSQPAWDDATAQNLVAA